ncbi:MAG: hypothetical protein E4H00_07860, partial [Myxococcales bacterium]
MGFPPRTRETSCRTSRGFDVNRLGTALAVFALGSLSTLASALEVPALTSRVNDYAELISPEVEARIEQTLTALEQDKGAQVVVLTIEELDGEQLEDYSLRVA